MRRFLAVAIRLLLLAGFVGLVLGALTTTMMTVMAGWLASSFGGELELEQGRWIRIGALSGAGYGVGLGLVSGSVAGAFAAREEPPDRPTRIALLTGGAATLATVTAGAIAIGRMPVGGLVGIAIAVVLSALVVGVPATLLTARSLRMR